MCSLITFSNSISLFQFDPQRRESMFILPQLRWINYPPLWICFSGNSFERWMTRHASCIADLRRIMTRFGTVSTNTIFRKVYRLLPDLTDYYLSLKFLVYFTRRKSSNSHLYCWSNTHDGIDWFTLITNSFYYKLTLNSCSFRLFPCSFSPDMNRLRFRHIKIYLIPFPWQPVLEIHNKSQAYVRTVIFGPWKASLMCFVFAGTELRSLFPRQRETVATPAGSNARR